MARAATSRRRNFPGFGWLTKKKLAHSSSALSKAFKAGQKAGDTGEFKTWLDRQRLGDISRGLRSKLEARFRDGVERGDAVQKKVDTRKQEREQEKEDRKRETEIQQDYAYGMGGSDKRAGLRPQTKFESLTTLGATKELGRAKAISIAKRYYRMGYAQNPQRSCARTLKSKVTDRAKRYRANQPGCKPKGAKKCQLCGSKRFLTVDHIDGNESNGRKANLRWLCKSCNTILGSEMAREGRGVRTEQYNPKKGAVSFDQWSEAIATLAGQGLGTMTVEQAREIVHNTSKRKRSEFNEDVWRIRKERYGPSGRKDGGAGGASGSDAPDWVTNPASAGCSTEYRLGYHLGQADRQSAQLRKTIPELHASFVANFGATPTAKWESFETAYAAGYSGQLGAAAPNPSRPFQYKGATITPVAPTFDHYDIVHSDGAVESGFRSIQDAKYRVSWHLEQKAFALRQAGNPHTRVNRGFSKKRNQDVVEGDGSPEYEQAVKTAELFHGRPVKEQIEVKESIRTHDWYVSIGPLINLKVKPLSKKPRPRVSLPFATKGEGVVQLFCSPDGRQLYLRGGDQELDLEAFGMGPGTRWYRDLMVIGECKEITYRDSKRFSKFVPTDFYHALGEETKVRPWLMYDTMNKKLEIAGGQYHVEMDDLVESMSPGLVN